MRVGRVGLGWGDGDWRGDFLQGKQSSVVQELRAAGATGGCTEGVQAELSVLTPAGDASAGGRTCRQTFSSGSLAA